MAYKYTLRRRGADKHTLYQLAVQDPSFEVELATRQYRRRRGVPPRILREDFCGTAAVACRWVEEHKENRAIGIDLDEATALRHPPQLPDEPPHWRRADGSVNDW